VSQIFLQRALPCVLLSAAIVEMMSPHDVITTNLTYTRDISRIFIRRCVACHAGGSSIPLTSYAEVRPWAVGIKEQVLSRSMPPWGAVKGFGNFSPDHALTQEEILIIATWVIGGAPEGNPALLPSRGSQISGQPAAGMRDALVITTPATLDHPVAVAGIRPLSERAVDSARIVAYLPNGDIEPLMWLYQFHPKWNRAFHFREPVELPAGSRITSTTPVRIALETDASSMHARR
jgi:hypothetical protein